MKSRRPHVPGACARRGRARHAGPPPAWTVGPLTPSVNSARLSVRYGKLGSIVHAAGLCRAGSAAAAVTMPASVASQRPGRPSGSGANKRSLTGVAAATVPRRAYVLRTSPRDEVVHDDAEVGRGEQAVALTRAAGGCRATGTACCGRCRATSGPAVFDGQAVERAVGVADPEGAARLVGDERVDVPATEAVDGGPSLDLARGGVEGEDAALRAGPDAAEAGRDGVDAGVGRVGLPRPGGPGRSGLRDGAGGASVSAPASRRGRASAAWQVEGECGVPKRRGGAGLGVGERLCRRSRRGSSRRRGRRRRGGRRGWRARRRRRRPRSPCCRPWCRRAPRPARASRR